MSRSNPHKTHDIAEFAIVLRDELAAHYASKAAADGEPFAVPSSHRIADLASALIRAARALHRRYEATCNGEWANTPKYLAQTTRQEETIAKLLQPYGIAPEFCGDPRGTPVKLILSRTRRANDWSGEGWVVPW